MKTIEEVTAYLKAELAETHEQYDEAQSAQERLFHLIKSATIKQILREIEEE